MKLNNKGFGVIEGLLVVIALTLIGGVGFYVVNANKNVEKTQSATTQANETTAQTKPAEVKKQYLEFKDLGVKLELNDKLRNAYTVKVGDSYYVSVHDFDSNPDLVACKAVASNDGSTGIFAILVGKVGQDDGIGMGDKWTQARLDDLKLKKVGDTYYGFVRGNGGACWEDNANQAKSEAIVNDFMSAFVAQENTFTKL